MEVWKLHSQEGSEKGGTEGPWLLVKQLFDYFAEAYACHGDYETCRKHFVESAYPGDVLEVEKAGEKDRFVLAVDEGGLRYLVRDNHT
jgi:hypothetical protein